MPWRSPRTDVAPTRRARQLSGRRLNKEPASGFAQFPHFPLPPSALSRRPLWMHALPAKIGVSGISGISDRERGVARKPEPLWIGSSSTSVGRERRLGEPPRSPVLSRRHGASLGFPLPMSSDQRCIERQLGQVWHNTLVLVNNCGCS